MADGTLYSVAAVAFHAAPSSGRLGSVAAVVFHGPVPPATVRLDRPAEAGRVWLLEVELGPETVYFASRAIELPSRRAGGARRYSAGLPDLSVEREGEDLAVRLPVRGFDALRARHGTPRGRPAVLRVWRGEPWVEDAEVLLRGVVGGVSWALPDAPDAIELSIVRPARESSRTIVPPTALLDRAAWPNMGEGPLGEHAPVVIGRPGSTAPIGSADRDAYPASPALVVDETAGVRTFVVACHHVAAANVSVFDLSEGAAPAAITSSIVNTVDWQGSPCATIGIPVVTIPAANENLFVAWTDGGGVVWRGAELRGLGTVIEWGALTHGRGAAEYDLAAIRSYRAELDALLVDAVLNDPALTWDDWLDAVAEGLGVERRESPRGTYYAPARWVPRETEIAATLTTEAGGGGYPVTRVGGYRDEAEELASEVTVYYAQHGEVRWPRRVTFSAEASDDPRVVRHPACAASAERGGVPLVVYAPTSDPATAWAVARHHVERYATSAYLAEYTGGPELDRLRRGETVEVLDGRRRLGVVLAAVLTERTVRVTVRVPSA